MFHKKKTHSSQNDSEKSYTQRKAKYIPSGCAWSLTCSFDPIVAQNATYDHHFIIKQLTKEPDGKFGCLGENTEKYITFSVPIKKELDNGKTVTYKPKFINSFRFMADKFSSLVDNLSEIYSKKCKDENCKSECDFIGYKNNKFGTNVKNVKKDG